MEFIKKYNENKARLRRVLVALTNDPFCTTWRLYCTSRCIISSTSGVNMFVWTSRSGCRTETTVLHSRTNCLVDSRTDNNSETHCIDGWGRRQECGDCIYVLEELRSAPLAMYIKWKKRERDKEEKDTCGWIKDKSQVEGYVEDAQDCTCLELIVGL